MKHLDVRPRVSKALADGRPVVALESTVIAHGLPQPHNLDTALDMEDAVKRHGAVPATVAVLDGRLVVGADQDEIQRLAARRDVAKVSRRDLAPVLASGGPGATTVAATMAAAAMAGIRVMATGGLGGIHRGAADTADVSADLTELARTPVAVVCAGVKSVLDLPRTLEALETLGVPVVGYGTDTFPAFYAVDSGLPLEARVEGPEEAAALLALQGELGLGTGVVIAVPPPVASSIPRAELERWIKGAEAAAKDAKVRGKAVTPFLLEQITTVSGGRTLEANIALLLQNASVAAQIAAALA